MSSRQEIVESLKALASKTGCALTVAPQATRNWLVDHSGLPADLVEILGQSWPDRTMWIGIYDLWTLEDLSGSERSQIALKNGYFMIGGAGNGDLLVVKRGAERVDDCEIGLISHEELWENETQLGQMYAPICNGLQNLLMKAPIEGALPLDFYEARDRRIKT